MLLSSDYSKSLHLQADRSLEFHTPAGSHYTTRIPRYGRDLVYDKRSAEALVPAVGTNSEGNGEVFRLNLEIGRFMRPFEVEVGNEDAVPTAARPLQGAIGAGSVDCAAVAEESHNLLGFGTSLGSVEFWDSRSRSRVGLLSVPAELRSTPAISALEFHRAGLTLATGTSSGLVYLYDLRSPVPLLKKDQGYGLPIQTITFLTPSTATRAQTSEPKILSADKKIIKIWNADDGAPWTSVEPAVDINSVAWCKDSGMILTANEGRQQHSFFVPQLGPAPKWCAFLDALVEEMAEDPTDPNAFRGGGEVYDNFKFLTAAQLKTLNLDHLVGRTNLLRPYMHGYFVAQRLYEEARLIADPFILEEERAKRVKEKMDKERESRIRGGKASVKVKVNKDLAAKVLAREEKRRADKAARRNGKDEAEAAAAAAEETAAVDRQPQLLRDTRFSALFKDKDFEVDQDSREYQMLNPNKPQSKPAGRTAVEDEEEEEMAERRSRSSDDESDGSEGGEGSDGSDGGDGGSQDKHSRGGRVEPVRSTSRPAVSTSQPTKDPAKAPLRMVSSFSNERTRSSATTRQDTSFGARLQERTRAGPRPSNSVNPRPPPGGVSHVTGDREITFAVPSQRKKGVKPHRAGGTDATAEERGEGEQDDERGDADAAGVHGGEKKRQKSRRDQARRSASGNVLRGLR